MNRYTPAIFENDIVGERPGLAKTVGATLGYRVDPLADLVGQTARFGIQRQAGYRPIDDPQVKGYEAYADSWGRATSPQHMAAILKTIDDSKTRRQVFADATLTNNLVAGIADPINLIAIPLIGQAATVGRAALRSGVGVAAIEAGAETLVMQPFDPVQSAEESAINVLTAGLFGGAIGGAISIPSVARAKAFENSQRAIREEFDALRRIENLSGMTREQIASAGPREQRRYGNLSDDELNDLIRGFDERASLAEQEARSYANTPEEYDFREQASSIREQAQLYKNEAGLRQLEEMQIDLQDPFNIKGSWFTDSVFFKAVSTPMKRALQSKYPSAVKEAFVKSFGDSGITLAMNSVGAPSPQSVFQRTAVANGRWVAGHDKLLRLWAAETNAPTANVLDINISDLSRRVSADQNTYRNWLQSVNEKRIQNVSDLTENEIKAVSVINDYFEDAARRLEDVGLLGTSRGMRNKINMLEAEIDGLRAELARLQSRKGNRVDMERSMIEGRISMLDRDLTSEREQLSALTDVVTTPEKEDVFFPRFWDQGAIRNNRQEFKDILYNWYRENPYIFEYDSAQKKYVQTMLSTDPVSIGRRVDQTIDRILNEVDPTNVDNIGFGYGRSKHFRHRQVDIPNKLVTKFIVTDPLAAMKTYAARIEPRYEYAKMFGRGVDGVMFDLERSMIRAGASTEDINKMRRDYMHMYDRVAGAVIRNPDTMSQKAAFFLREAASFSYMGSAGLAAFPDFGRILLEYDLQDVVRGVQGLADRSTVKMAVDETRIAGEAIDILRGSAHLRMMEDLGNNVDASNLLSQARNAFYILNGLAPITTIAKQLAGIIDAHTIIDYSIKLTRGELSPRDVEWLARYGIGEDQAKLIARAPWQKTENGLYLANTEQWADSIFIPEIEGKRVNVIEINDDGTPVGKMQNGRYVPAFYRESDNTIRFDRDYIEGPMFEEKAWLNPKMEGVDALPDIFKTPKQWSNFVMLHEIMHTRFRPEDVGIFARDIAQEPIQVRVASDSFTFERSYYSVGMMRREFDRLEAEVGNQSELLSAYRSQDVPAREVADLIENYEQNVSILEELARLLNTPEYIKRAELENAAGKIRSLSAEQKAQYENRINQMALEEYRAQQTLNEETVLNFRSALNSGVLNTIMSGTPADKPIITDGVAYIPMSVARQFGMKEDPKIRGYARIENGLMGLPFQFYSYALANVNKTVGAMAHGQLKNRAIGMTTMLGLAYMSLQIRTPDYIWQDMSWQDKFARSFDMSGIMALYSDLFYTSMHTSLALGGPNITNEFLSPKFPQQPSMIDAVTGFAGAGPSWLSDTASGVYQFANGEYGEGAKAIARQMPFARMWFWKDEVNQITNAWAN